ncbi:interleukin-25-like [Glandiceps talaboti]
MLSPCKPIHFLNPTDGVPLFFQITVSLCALFVIGCHCNPVKRASCLEPDQDDLKAILKEYNANALQYATTAGTSSSPSSTNCPISYGSDAPSNVRSTCPFYQTEKTNLNRYPTTLVEAECYNCPNCVTDLIRRDDYHPNWTCDKLTTKVWVLEKSDNCNSKGYYEYSPVEINVSLACVCLRDRI